MTSKMALALLPLASLGCSASLLRPVEVTDAAVDLEQVTHTKTNEFDPAVSPNGKTLAYEIAAAEGQPRRIEVTSLGGRRLYTSSRDGTRPAWMPDSSSIVFIHDRKLVQTFGQGVRPVFLADVGDTSMGGRVDRPVVSPDGKLVVMSMGGVSVQKPGWLFPRTYDQALGVTDLLGSGIKVIGHGTDPAFSPDGKHIAFARQVGEHQHLFIANADGSNPVQITDGANDDETPTFSPDGKTIAYCSIPEDKQHEQANLFEVATDGGGLVQLTEGDRYACHPSWASDGYIYFHANAGHRFHIWRLRTKPS